MRKFEQSQTLTEIDVSECYLGPEALPPLAKAIKAMAALNSSLLNSVPAPRDYGILHQLAYHGATDEYLLYRRPIKCKLSRAA